MKTNLFRKEALQFFSSLEEVEPPFLVPKARHWIFWLATFLLLLTLTMIFKGCR